MLSLLMVIASCTNNISTAPENKTEVTPSVESPQPKTEIPATDVEEKTESELTPEDGTKTIIAKFVKFSLGDASHYIFKDESGDTWDFGGCDSKNFIFENELDESESNSDNQGWGSNKELQGKWFVISYYQKEEPLYIDGPIGMVNVIKEVKLKQD